MESPVLSLLRWMAERGSTADMMSLSSGSSRGSSDSTSPSSRESTISESCSVSWGSSRATTLSISRASFCSSDALRSGLCSSARFSTTLSFASSVGGELLEADGGARIGCGEETVLSLIVELVLCPRRGPPSVVLILALAPAFQVIVGVWPAEETGEPCDFFDATVGSRSPKSGGGLLRSKATVRESSSSAIGSVRTMETQHKVWSVFLVQN